MKRMLSIALVLLSITAMVYINSEIAGRYNRADGKTKALFGLIELTYNYKYYILIPAVLSILLIVRSLRLRELRVLHLLVILLALIAIAGTLTSSWRLFT